MKDARIALGNKWMHGWLAGGMDGWELEDGMVIFFGYRHKAGQISMIPRELHPGKAEGRDSL